MYQVRTNFYYKTTMAQDLPGIQSRLHGLRQTSSWEPLQDCTEAAWPSEDWAEGLRARPLFSRRAALPGARGAFDRGPRCHYTLVRKH